MIRLPILAQGMGPLGATRPYTMRGETPSNFAASLMFMAQSFVL